MVFKKTSHVGVLLILDCLKKHQRSGLEAGGLGGAVIFHWDLCGSIKKCGGKERSIWSIAFHEPKIRAVSQSDFFC